MCEYFNKVKTDLEELQNFVAETFKNNNEKIEVTEKSTKGPKARVAEEAKNKQNLSIISYFANTGENIYKNLNLSVINGSYVQNENFEDKIRECYKLIENIRITIPESEEIIDQIDGFFCRILLHSLKQYHYFAHSFQVSITSPDKLFLLSDIEEEKKRKNNIATDLEALEPFHDIFYYNILISFIDKNFSLNTDTLRELLDIVHKLKNKKCNEEFQIYCKILIDKCTLLILKFRLKYDNEDLFKSLLISHDFTDEEFNPKNLKTEYLKSFQDIISKLYSKDSEESHEYFNSYYQKNQNKKNLTFTDYFIHIRYYSKVEKNIEEIDKLIKQFENQYGESIVSKFDKFSYNISINYLYNNRISFLTTEETDINKIDNLFKEIQQLQIRTGIKNYFPFYKIARYYSDFINRNINDKKGNKNQINDALTKLQAAITLIERNLEWTARLSIRPFQPNYDACCANTKIGETNFNIFIASAYVVPINYTYFQKELEKLKEEYLVHKSVVKINEFVEATLSKEHAEIEEALKREHDYVVEAHDEAKESQKNNIQILSVFAALVIFAVGNIQVFKIVETLKEAVIFMLTLAYSLCLFAIVIWFIVSYKKVKMSLAHYFLIGALFLGLLFSGLAIFTNWGDTPITFPQTNNKNKKIDLNIDTILPQNASQVNIGTTTTPTVKNNKANFQTPPLREQKQTTKSLKQY